MLVGSMNNPALPLEAELERVAAAGFDFVDITLEPPSAWPCDGEAIGRRLHELGLGAVGHTAWYLPYASPFEELRREAHRLFHLAFETFAAAGVDRVTLHPDPITNLFPVEEVRKRNAEAVAELSDEAKRRGVQLMVENLGRAFSTVEDLTPVFEAADGALFHLDVAHANLGRGRGQPNRTRELLDAFGSRLAHVHVSDNFGVDDLHLPLGAGSVDWPAAVAAVKAAGWDGTVTLEIFSVERRHLDASRRLWLEWWNGSAPG